MATGREAATARSAARALPVWVLLVAVALAPTAGMAFYAWRDVQGTERVVERIEVIEGMVVAALAARELAYVVPMEHVPGQALAQAGEFGLTEAEAASALGFDLRAELGRARAATDSVLEANGGEVGGVVLVTTTLLDDLAAARDLVDSGASADEVNRAYLSATALVDAASAQQVLEVRTALVPLPVADVDDALRLLTDTMDLADAAMAEIWALADILFTQDDLTSVQRLLAAEARFQRAATEVSARMPPRLADRWAAVEQSEVYVSVDEAVTAAVEGRSPLQEGDLDAVGAVFSDTFARGALLDALVQDVGADTLALLDEAAWAAELDRRRTAAASAALVVLTIGLALGASLVITRPLGRLASGARAVSSGDLDSATFGEGGPREIDVVSAALDEVVVNLRRIEAQAEALARGDLEDGVLASRVPNALGESLHRSVAQLSRSMRAQEDLRHQLVRQAAVDPLTELLNRAGSIRAIDDALARSARSGQLVGLLYVDLDGFKRTNDDHGHSVGDEVLRRVAERLATVVRGGDVVGRLGGDEFIIVVESVADPEALVKLGERVVEVVSEPVDIEGRRADVGASIGVAIAEGDGHSALQLLQEADHAVYRAKRSGRRRVEVFDDVLRSELAERAAIEADLRRALHDDELFLVYQPVVDARSRELRSVEALVRWERPGHGVVPPLDFIPVAEASDLIIDLGRWVLGRATEQVGRWSDEPALRDVGVAVNLSGRHLMHPSVVPDVGAALRAAELDPGRLTVEITETVVLSDNAALLDHAEQLRSMGVRLAIDDFGTGYTSMSQLGRLPVDVLKIDQAFVAAMAKGSDRSVVELTVGVGHTLDLELIAEGVEEQAQFDALRSLGCDEVQGFLVSPPLRADELVSWARHRGQGDPAGGGEPAS